MATVTNAVVAVAAGDAWTLALTPGGTITAFVQNRSLTQDVLVRIGASTATNDAVTAAAELLHPGEGRSIPLSSGDKVHARTLGPEAAALIVRTS